MKILMISSFLPFPLYSGGQVRLYNLIRELSEKHEITLICEKRDNQSQQDIKAVEKICKKVVVVNRKKQWSIANILKSTFSPNSFLLTGHTNRDMQMKILEETEKQKFDLIHVETYYVMQNLPSINIPVVLAEHNIEYQVYGKYADQITPVLRPLLKIDIAKIKKEEKRFWKKAERVIAVSEEDKKVMKDAGITAAIVANGVDVEKFAFLQRSKIKDQRSKKIMFIGDFRWIQNRDSVKFIIEEIWPEIELRIIHSAGSGQANQELRENVKLWIVGRHIPDSLKTLTNNSNIIFDEESSAKPAEELFHAAEVLLAPIRVGGGTSYKILESMSSGTPVVTTMLSADAIGAKDGVNIMASDEAQKIAEKTIDVLNDTKLYGKLAKNARVLIEEKYTWKKIASDLEAVYSELRIKN